MGIRKLVLLTLAALLSVITTVTPRADAAMSNSLHIIVGDDFLNTEISPIAEQGRTLVPIRPVVEKLKFNVEWNSSTKNIIITSDVKEIKLTIDKKEVLINSKAINLDAAPRLVSGRTLVPLRFVSEALDQFVVYDGSFNGTPMIWVTSHQLLADEDIVPNENFTNVSSDELPPVYKLKENGETLRHIRLGDSLAKVKQVYGVPRREELDSHNSGFIEYFSKFLPFSDGVTIMRFIFDKGKLTEVVMH